MPGAATANAAGVGQTEGVVVVANQVSRRFVRGKGVSELTRDPFGGRLVGQASAHQAPSGVTQNQKLGLNSTIAVPVSPPDTA